MPNVDLEVEPVSASVLSGEALPVYTTVRNHGAQTVWTRDEMQPSSYTYRLEPQRPDREACVLSERQVLVSLYEAPTMPQVVKDAVEVAPGKSARREEEIAWYSREPLQTGRYALTVSNDFPEGRVISNPAPLEIALPRMQTFISQPCPLSQTRSNAFAHRETDGRVTLLQRESLVGKPVHSVYFRREELPKESSPQLALAVKLGPTAGGGRWMAVLNGGSLQVLYCHGNTVSVRLGPVRVEQPQARLLATGFETTGQAPVFFVASGTQIQAFQGLQKDFGRKWSMSLPFVLPERYFLRAKPGDALTQVTFVAIEARETSTRAVAATYHPDTQKVEPTVTVADIPARLAAADMLPLEGSDAAGTKQQLHLLSVPDARKQLSYYTMPLSGATPSPEPRRFAGPAPNVDRWSITCMMDAHPVLAQAGSRLLFSRAAGGAWDGVASGQAPISHAMISSEDGYDCYAEWLDGERGFRLVRVISF